MLRRQCKETGSIGQIPEQHSDVQQELDFSKAEQATTDEADIEQCSGPHRKPIVLPPERDSAKGVKVKIAGRLPNFYKEWVKITRDKFIFNCVRGYKIFFIETPVQQSIPSSPSLESTRILIDNQIAINRLVEAGADS